MAKNLLRKQLGFLAQATIGEGRVILAGFGEMRRHSFYSNHGAEPFKGAVEYVNEMDIGLADRVWIIARSDNDANALELSAKLSAIDSFHSRCCC